MIQASDAHVINLAEQRAAEHPCRFRGPVEGTPHSCSPGQKSQGLGADDVDTLASSKRSLKFGKAPSEKPQEEAVSEDNGWKGRSEGLLGGVHPLAWVS